MEAYTLPKPRPVAPPVQTPPAPPPPKAVEKTPANSRDTIAIGFMIAGVLGLVWSKM